MTDWVGIVGQSFTADDFVKYCKSIRWLAWRPTFVVLHNTASPNLNDRPNGLTKQHILDLETYYRSQMHWSAGPHLFIDDHQIWVFTPLTHPGVHSPSWNNVSLGIEMLGDYSVDDFTVGRGKAVKSNTVAAITTVTSILGLNPDSMQLHHDDPLTTHHDCPGGQVGKQDVIGSVQKAILAMHAGEHALIMS